MSFLSKRMKECDGTTSTLSFRKRAHQSHWLKYSWQVIVSVLQVSKLRYESDITREKSYSISACWTIHLTWGFLWWISKNERLLLNIVLALALKFSVLLSLPLSLTRQTMFEMYFCGDLKKYTYTKCHQAFSHRDKY